MFCVQLANDVSEKSFNKVKIRYHSLWAVYLSRGTFFIQFISSKPTKLFHSLFPDIWFFSSCFMNIECESPEFFSAQFMHCSDFTFVVNQFTLFHFKVFIWEWKDIWMRCDGKWNWLKGSTRWIKYHTGCRRCVRLYLWTSK